MELRLPTSAMPYPAEPQLRLEVVSTSEAFEALAPDWHALQDRCSRKSVFSSWEWNSLWWRVYGQKAALRIIVAREGSRVVGILPLYIQRLKYYGIFTVRLLRFVGTGGNTAPDYLGPLIADDVAPRVSAELADQVARKLGGWDVMQLSDLTPNTEFVKEMTQRCERQGCIIKVDEWARIPFGKLAPTFDEYLATLSTNRRQSVRNRRRRFEKLEGAQFLRCTDIDELDAMFDRLAELHRMRWQGRAVQHSFASEEYLSFHRALIHALFLKDHLRLFALKAEGEIFAILYCFKFNGEMLYFQSGFDPVRAELSPGQVLIGYVIEAAIADHCHTFDMLKGDYDHKRYFFKDTRVTVQLSAYKGGRAAWGYRLKKLMSSLRSRPEPKGSTGSS